MTEPTYEDYEMCALCYYGEGEYNEDKCFECEGTGLVSPHHVYEQKDDRRFADEEYN